ncbi:hypothetical protein K0M31_001241 [Melipona bicolor]|uniref:Uncharacterized protein n=1 Tax=Melipona bicolor TaxID=60889 RepID=A0AA40KXK7_9HYME|nr:hypothetical protein K0M31_001241 [Melipona bicolor]
MENGDGERPWWRVQWRGNGLPTCRLRAQSVSARCKLHNFSSLYVWEEAGYVNEGTVRRIAEVKEEVYRVAKGEEEERDVVAERRPRAT